MQQLRSKLEKKQCTMYRWDDWYCCKQKHEDRNGKCVAAMNMMDCIAQV